MKKRNYFLLILYILFSIQPALAADCESMSDAFEKYQCRVENVCATYQENKKVFNPENFKPADDYQNIEIADVFLRSGINQKPIRKAVSVYKENMNSIYKCSMIGIQRNSILNIQKKLIKIDKTGEIVKALNNKIDNIINRLDMISHSSQCLGIDDTTIFNKLSILRQTTYETCKFGFYTQYLKEYYQDPAKALGMSKEDLAGNQENTSTKEMTTKQAADTIAGINNSLDMELDQAYKIFPIAYHAYSEYENNYPIHFLLELVKEDYMVFRDNLYATLNPINQVVYKISNAMKY